MINIIWNGKRKSFNDIETLKRKLGLTHIDDDKIEQLKKASSRGDWLYGWINPYESQMSIGEDEQALELILAESQEELDNLYDTLAENV